MPAASVLSTNRGAHDALAGETDRSRRQLSATTSKATAANPTALVTRRRDRDRDRVERRPVVAKADSSGTDRLKHTAPRRVVQSRSSWSVLRPVFDGQLCAPASACPCSWQRRCRGVRRVGGAVRRRLQAPGDQEGQRQPRARRRLDRQGQAVPRRDGRVGQSLRLTFCRSECIGVPLIGWMRGTPAPTSDPDERVWTVTEVTEVETAATATSPATTDRSWRSMLASTEIDTRQAGMVIAAAVIWRPTRGSSCCCSASSSAR